MSLLSFLFRKKPTSRFDLDSFFLNRSHRLRMDAIKPYLAKADTLLSQYPLLVDLERRTQVPKVYAAASVWLVLTASLFFQVAAGVSSTILGLTYPLYKTLEAISRSDLNKLRLWATYLLVWTGIGLLETGGLLASLIPFYYVVKTALCLWLYLPQYLV